MAEARAPLEIGKGDMNADWIKYVGNQKYRDEEQRVYEEMGGTKPMPKLPPLPPSTPAKQGSTNG